MLHRTAPLWNPSLNNVSPASGRAMNRRSAERRILEAVAAPVYVHCIWNDLLTVRPPCRFGPKSTTCKFVDCHQRILSNVGPILASVGTGRTYALPGAEGTRKLPEWFLASPRTKSFNVQSSTRQRPTRSAEFNVQVGIRPIRRCSTFPRSSE